jgi:periplasmic protein TonB
MNTTKKNFELIWGNQYRISHPRFQNKQQMKNILIFCFVFLGYMSLRAQKRDSNIVVQSPPIIDYIPQPDNMMLYNIGNVQMRPQFPEDVKKYLADSIRYPEDAKKKKIEGTVYLSVIIEKNGSISNIIVLRSPDTSLDNEAKRVISTMPRWSPGKQNGVPVRVNYLIPVHFKL